MGKFKSVAVQLLRLLALIKAIIDLILLLFQER